MADITMPQLGETVTEGTITRWYKQVGETIAEDEVLFEVSTDKVDSEVPSPVSGVLTEIRVPEGETVDVGEVLAVVGDASGAAVSASPAEPVAADPIADPIEPAPGPPAPVTPVASEPPAAPPTAAPSTGSAPDVDTDTATLLSPVVRRLVSEHGVDISQIAGSGVGGRITRSDVEAHVASRGASSSAPAAAPPVAASAPPVAASAPPVAASAPPATAPSVVPAPAPAPTSRPAATPVLDGDIVVPFNNIRRRTAEHMVMSKAVSPHVISIVEVDYEGVEKVRRAEKARFKEDEGFSLTYLPFIARASVDALREFPHINASVADNGLVVHRHVNLSIAVDLDFTGLVAPVVAQADEQRIRGIARSISDLAARARAKQLGPDELVGGTFTLSNSGSFGSHMVAPIINQPQVAIMSTDGVSRKPVVVTDESGNEAIAIHSVGLLTLCWDHRAIDGAYAAAFMRRVKEIIETRDWAAELS